MDKQKQIGEMARIIAVLAGLSAYEKAEFLVTAGYRKIPENAVVLAKEEYQRHKGFSREEVDEISETAIKNARKETAEKFAQKAKETFFHVNCSNFDDWNWYYDKLGEICKEITEGD